MVQKPELIAFAQYRLGGVQNFYFNILRHLDPDQFDLLWIFDDSSNKDNARLPQPYGICQEIVFESDHPRFETAYDKFKGLAKHISNRPGLVLTNFFLELSTLHTNPRSNKTIYFICHDELYLNQAKEYGFLIDVFIAHNPVFYRSLIELFPDRKENIFYLPYGVSLPSFQRKPTPEGPLRLIYAARHVKEKGVDDLPEIIELVEKGSADVYWTILGDGPCSGELKEKLASRKNVRFLNPKGNDEVRNIMAEQDVFILPSYLDGLPVAMLEAMSVGCVPVLYQFNSGIVEIIDPGTGFVTASGDKKAFAAAILQLSKDATLLETMSLACRQKVANEYRIEDCVKRYAELFSRYAALKRPTGKKFIAYGGLLEHPMVPSFIRKQVRKIKTRFK
ncbi:glycosyltransferase family 4 protein [Paraflavitalea pollutisoli]|uniref:glycosyltransferase family 4 protein n=1 Tax=Paraflavitalea pollutisoli TaxID=3034143 RepID=UPI0023EC3E47|nr:glycosyltransferase family 4 protein [Paraflavitalea sp. H1-2-19X]